MSARGTWQGMLAIVRFNWPFYVAAAAVAVGSSVALILVTGLWAKLLCALVLGGALYFVVISLGVSHVIYDRSDLYRWRWLRRALPGEPPSRAIFCHSGFDEASGVLKEKFAATEWLVLDHFDAAQMTEASILRARELYPPTAETVPAPFDHWPAASGFADVIFALLAIHEFREARERSAWFAEARRCLRDGGRILLVEHVRDFANFLAFGPGFVHFHSPETWRTAWESAGLRCADEFRVTPWVRVFVLTAA